MGVCMGLKRGLIAVFGGCVGGVLKGLQKVYGEWLIDGFYGVI